MTHFGFHSSLIGERHFLLVVQVLVAIVGVLLFGSGCKTQQQATQDFTPPIYWSTVNKSEQEFRRHFDDNRESLDALEGIWTVSESGTWRNVYSGMNGTLPHRKNDYRIAIVRDSSKPNYDFTAVVLETENPYWMAGRVKAHFRKTAYERAYDALWYMGNYSEERGSYVIEESGLIKVSRTAYDPNNQYIEVTTTSLFVKAYPPINNQSRPGEGDKSLKGSGSGFLFTSTGLIVTNYHVVENANRIEVVFPEKHLKKSGTVRIKDAKNDIAVVEVKEFSYSDISAQPIPYSFADISSVKVGQEVFTLGFPLGDIMGTKSRLSTGRINSQFGIQDDPRLFQISNPLQPGNSGGPLFNLKGELVGVVVSSLNAKYFYDNAGIIPQNVNFAVKANYLQSLIAMIPEGDEAMKRKNVVNSGPMENQIEQLNSFIVQIRVY